MKEFWKAGLMVNHFLETEVIKLNHTHNLPQAGANWNLTINAETIEAVKLIKNLKKWIQFFF
jgi:hypothetical protein